MTVVEALQPAVTGGRLRHDRRARVQIMHGEGGRGRGGGLI